MAGENGPPVLNGAQYYRPNKTLLELRQDLLARLGFAAQLTNQPTGVKELLNSFLQDAQTQLYYRYHILHQMKWWSVSVTANNRFYDIPYEGAYSGRRTDIAFLDTNPDTITSAADFAALGFGAGTKFRVIGSAANDDKIYTVATAVGGTITLAGTDAVTAETAGAAIELQEIGFSNMEFRRVSEAWIQDGNRWSRMVAGIPSELFNVTTSNIPTHFDLREYIEIFPAPDQAYTLHFKAHMGLQHFTADTDYCTLDPHIVLLMALANAKAHYGQADANAYYRQAEIAIGRLNVGNFHLKRYIPCESPVGDVPESYPQVTFPRT